LRRARRQRQTVDLTFFVYADRQIVSTQIVLLDVVPKGPEAHPQELGRLDLHAAGPLERFRDIAALDFLDVRLEIEARGGKNVSRWRRRCAAWDARRVAPHT